MSYTKWSELIERALKAGLMPAPDPHSRKALEAAGVRFGPEEAGRFAVTMKLPSGWRVRHGGAGTEGNIVDGKGRVRATFRLEDASPAGLNSWVYARPRFQIYDGNVFDNTRTDGNRVYSGKDERSAEAWLNQHYPKWQDSAAHWDDK